MSNKHKTQRHQTSNKAIVNFKIDSSHKVNSRLDSIESRLNKLESPTIYKSEFEDVKKMIRRSFRISYLQAVGIGGLSLFVIQLAILINALLTTSLAQYSLEHFYTLVISGILVWFGWSGIQNIRKETETPVTTTKKLEMVEFTRKLLVVFAVVSFIILFALCLYFSSIAWASRISFILQGIAGLIAMIISMLTIELKKEWLVAILGFAIELYLAGLILQLYVMAYPQ
jgi:hypothetical protein